MKVLVFLMGNVDSFEMSRPLLHTLTGARVEVTLVHYSSEELVPVDDLIATGARYLALSDGGFSTIPRLSQRQYVALCGDDIDFLGCQYHNLVRTGFPSHSGLPLPRLDVPSVVPRLRLPGRGPAARMSPRCGDRQPRQRAALEDAFRQIEPARLPDALDGERLRPGQGASRSTSACTSSPVRTGSNGSGLEVRDAELSPHEQQRLDRYLEGWRQRGASKYAQTESDSEIEVLREFVADGRRVLFVVDQFPTTRISSTASGPSPRSPRWSISPVRRCPRIGLPSTSSIRGTRPRRGARGSGERPIPRGSRCEHPSTFCSFASRAHLLLERGSRSPGVRQAGDRRRSAALRGPRAHARPASSR